MRSFFEWLEGDNARLRKVMLFSALMSNILITFLILFLVYLKTNISGFLGFYTAFIGLGMTAIGFYTATKPKERCKDV